MAQHEECPELSVERQRNIPNDVIARWQRLVDLMADLIGVPAGLIMRLVGADIQVLLSSDTAGNPYRAGMAAPVYGSGLYCEMVVRTNCKLLIPNALESEVWRENPDIELDMISYLGFPIRWPDGSSFGTICVLDNKENFYSATHVSLLEEFRDLVESHLQLVHAESLAQHHFQNATRLATDLKRQKELAEDACRVQSNFIAAASHDLRQPIHALNLFIGALLQVPMAAEGVCLVEQIEATTNSLDELFAALLDISRLNAGVVQAHCRPFRIGSILHRVCNDIAGDAAAKNLHLSYIPCKAIVNSDPLLIERILRNLLSNAVRYTDTGRIVVGCRYKPSHVSVQILDTGRGIPRHLQSRIFEDYYRVDNPGRDGDRGVGLGLSIVRRLTDLLECKLTLDSEPGRGSRFEVMIERTKYEVAARETSNDDRNTCPVSGLVVVIDDEQAIRTGMSRLLDTWGCQVIATASANEAIRLLSTCILRPALLICDFRLADGESGVDAINRLRVEYNYTIPAILITGDMGSEQEAKLPSIGRTTLLYKPVPNHKLKSAVRILIKDPEAAQLCPVASPSLKIET
ncbi:ATP-binding protein [Paraburkholderia bryophila]|uniref:ATP-binding protein n=1 Tax=Paraburkholderia bryophila TaxID=420952 RepID=UPI0023494FC6|nr:ATP-binding protein [Paraburkholderia bryophila]WCM22570.1 ATP-binding protein [Paraburkholderia bryophila]